MEKSIKEKSVYVKEEAKTKMIRKISIAFVVSYFLMPQYVGIPVPGFDLTVNRMFLIILYAIILTEPCRTEEFKSMMRQYKYIVPVICFEIVLL